MQERIKSRLGGVIGFVIGAGIVFALMWTIKGKVTTTADAEAMLKAGFLKGYELGWMERVLEGDPEAESAINTILKTQEDELRLEGWNVPLRIFWNDARTMKRDLLKKWRDERGSGE